MNWIAASDAGKLALAALMYPERFDKGNTYYPIGNNRFSHQQIAIMMSEILNSNVRHETITQKEWEQQLLKKMQTNSGINEDIAKPVSVLGARSKHLWNKIGFLKI